MNRPESWLLATDMDGTVIPLEESPRRQAEVAEFRAAMEDRDDVILAYVTGRDLEMALAGIQRFRLPVPDLLACDVGTGVYRREGERFVPDPVYRDRMREAMGGMTASGIQEVLQGAPGLRLQEGGGGGEYKVSYDLERAAPGSTDLRTVRERLEEAGARVSLVLSRDPYRGVDLLDVLPAGVAKDTAVRFLHDETGVAEERLVYAGDSGNDRAAMLSGYRVVVVGNAPDDLKAELREEAEERGVTRRLYYAREPYAAGVLEGLRHWGMLEG